MRVRPARVILRPHRAERVPAVGRCCAGRRAGISLTHGECAVDYALLRPAQGAAELSQSTWRERTALVRLFPPQAASAEFPPSLGLRDGASRRRTAVRGSKRSPARGLRAGQVGMRMNRVHVSTLGGGNAPAGNQRKQHDGHRGRVGSCMAGPGRRSWNPGVSPATESNPPGLGCSSGIGRRGRLQYHGGPARAGHGKERSAAPQTWSVSSASMKVWQSGRCSGYGRPGIASFLRYRWIGPLGRLHKGPEHDG